MTRLLDLHLFSPAELRFDRSAGTNFLPLSRSSVFVGELKVQTEEPELVPPSRPPGPEPWGRRRPLIDSVSTREGQLSGRPHFTFFFLYTQATNFATHQSQTRVALLAQAVR